MEKEIEVSSIKITMGKKEVDLTIEEAKKIKKALEEIFSEKVVEKTEHHHHHDYYRQYYPIWSTNYAQKQTFDFGQVYCSTGKSMGDIKASCLNVSIQ